MLAHLIKKELLDNFTSPKFLFIFLLCMILIIVSVLTGARNYTDSIKEHRAGEALYKKNLESQPTWGALAGIGLKINKPPEVLSSVVSGIEGDLGRVATVNIAYDPTLEDSQYSSNPIFAIFGSLDLMFIVKIVLSLFAILFTYDAICGEKERGTLKLMFSNSIPRDKYILAKALGGFISLLLPFLIPLLIGLIILVIYPGISISNTDWIRLLWIGVFFLLYLSVFFVLGLFVSARTSRPAISFLILLFGWVLFVSVIPKLSIMVASQINPVPSVHEITAQKDAFLQEIQRTTQEDVRKWMNDNPNDGSPDFNEKFREAIRDIQNGATSKIDAENGRLEQAFQDKQRRQRQIAMNFARISPTSSMTFAVMSMAGTGIERHEKFLNTVKAYKPIFTKYVNNKMINAIDFSQQNQQQGKLDISDMPVFNFKGETISDSLNRSLVDVLVLGLMTILFFMLSFVSFLRYDLR